jgi:hypothetical protein
MASLPLMSWRLTESTRPASTSGSILSGIFTGALAGSEARRGRAGTSRTAPFGSPLVELPEGLPARCAAAGPGMARGHRGISPRALLRSLRSIARSELDFKLVDLVPLGFASLSLGNREKLLQALTRGNRLRFIHGGDYLAQQGFFVLLRANRRDAPSRTTPALSAALSISCRDWQAEYIPRSGTTSPRSSCRC